MKRKNQGFFVYNDYIKPAQKALSEEQFKDFATAMILYGTVGTYPSINPIAEVFLLQLIPLIDKYDMKYTSAKTGGANGGRKPIVTKVEIKKAIQNKGFTSASELSSYFNCCERTILRHITKEEIIQCTHVPRGFLKRDE